MTDAPRRRDPERRRREIIAAAAAIVVEEGPDALTHRKVAARAEVPLGSTTQYFATLDDLREAALTLLVEDAERWLGELEAEFVRAGASAGAYIEALYRYLEDTHLVGADFAVTCAAPLHRDLRQLGIRWERDFLAVLTRYITAESAAAVAMFTDGAIMQTALSGQPADRALIDHAIGALWNPREGERE